MDGSAAGGAGEGRRRAMHRHQQQQQQQTGGMGGHPLNQKAQGMMMADNGSDDLDGDQGNGRLCDPKIPPARTIYVTNLGSKDKADIKGLCMTLPGFVRVQFGQTNFRVVLKDAEQAKDAMARILATNKSFKASYARKEPEEKRIEELGEPSKVLWTSTLYWLEPEFRKYLMTYEGFERMVFDTAHSWVHFRDVDCARRALEDMNATTNLYSVYSKKFDRETGNAIHPNAMQSSNSNSQQHQQHQQQRGRDGLNRNSSMPALSKTQDHGMSGGARSQWDSATDPRGEYNPGGPGYHQQLPPGFVPSLHGGAGQHMSLHGGVNGSGGGMAFHGGGSHVGNGSGLPLSVLPQVAAARRPPLTPPPDVMAGRPHMGIRKMASHGAFTTGLPGAMKKDTDLFGAMGGVKVQSSVGAEHFPVRRINTKLPTQVGLPYVSMLHIYILTLHGKIISNILLIRNSAITDELELRSIFNRIPGFGDILFNNAGPIHMLFVRFFSVDAARIAFGSYELREVLSKGYGSVSVQYRKQGGVPEQWDHFLIESLDDDAKSSSNESSDDHYSTDIGLPQLNGQPFRPEDVEDSYGSMSPPSVVESAALANITTSASNATMPQFGPAGLAMASVDPWARPPSLAGPGNLSLSTQSTIGSLAGKDVWAAENSINPAPRFSADPWGPGAAINSPASAVPSATSQEWHAPIIAIASPSQKPKQPSPLGRPEEKRNEDIWRGGPLNGFDYSPSKKVELLGSNDWFDDADGSIFSPVDRASRSVSEGMIGQVSRVSSGGSGNVSKSSSLASISSLSKLSTFNPDANSFIPSWTTDEPPSAEALEAARLRASGNSAGLIHQKQGKAMRHTSLGKATFIDEDEEEERMFRGLTSPPETSGLPSMLSSITPPLTPSNGGSVNNSPSMRKGTLNLTSLGNGVGPGAGVATGGPDAEELRSLLAASAERLASVEQKMGVAVEAIRASGLPVADGVQDGGGVEQMTDVVLQFVMGMLAERRQALENLMAAPDDDESEGGSVDFVAGSSRALRKPRAAIASECHDRMLKSIMFAESFDSTESSEGSSSAVSWINWYCSLPGHEFFLEVPEEFIEDEFNLTGLNTAVVLYNEALDMILDLEPSSPHGGTQLALIESAAETLYGLIHQRYLLTRPALQAMAEKWRELLFGVCPRYGCGDIGILPCGRTDQPGIDTAKYQNLDGAFFGTTFPHMFFMTFPDLLPPLTSPPRLTTSSSFRSRDGTSSTLRRRTSAGAGGVGKQKAGPNEEEEELEDEEEEDEDDDEDDDGSERFPDYTIYEPKIFGFRVSELSRTGPRMLWLRYKISGPVPRGYSERVETMPYNLGVD
ncbi:casein kinase 2 regulatory subunit [Irineochytrium annulatum]|nr:casein kinase 2 regulatory subunit [Irineochytrium annulatum]